MSFLQKLLTPSKTVWISFGQIKKYCMIQNRSPWHREPQYSLVVLYVLITSYIKVYVSDTEAVEACIRFVDDDDEMLYSWARDRIFFLCTCSTSLRGLRTMIPVIRSLSMIQFAVCRNRVVATDRLRTMAEDIIEDTYLVAISFAYSFHLSTTLSRCKNLPQVQGF